MLAGWKFSSKGASRDAPPLAVVQRKDFTRTVRLSGSLQAVESYMVVTPQLTGSQVTNMVVTRLQPAGAYVKRNDILVEFDRQGVVQDFLDHQAEYQERVRQTARQQADEAAASARDDTELKQAEDDLQKAKLEMRRNEVIAPIDAEMNRLELEETESRLEQLRTTYELRRRMALAGDRELEIQTASSRSVMTLAQQNEAMMSIRSPMNGIVVLKSIWKGGQLGDVGVGDQVWAGLPILQVVNPGTMEIESSVNQEDFPALRIGQVATVRLDAYPGAVFSGKLQQLSPVAIASDFSENLRQFSANFSIDQKDPRLTPDLFAAVDVQLDRLSDVLVVPRAAITQRDGRFFVQVKHRAGWQQREVTIRAMNDLEAVIDSGLSAGEVVRADQAMQ